MTKPPPKPAIGLKLERRRRHEQEMAELKRQRLKEREERAQQYQEAHAERDRERRRIYTRPVILMVEDDLGRMEDAKRWMPADMRHFVCPEECVALGTVGRSGDEDYAGIMLDFDLRGGIHSPDRPVGNTLRVARKIAEVVAKDTPILVHSMNSVDRADIVSILQKAGFTVTVIPWWDMTEEKFRNWLETCREVWRDRKENQN
jgi:hypothetical protein